MVSFYFFFCFIVLIICIHQSGHLLQCEVTEYLNHISRFLNLWSIDNFQWNFETCEIECTILHVSGHVFFFFFEK